MAFSESLTIRILADSSELRNELNDAASEIENLQSRLADVSSAVGGLQSSFGRLSSATQPLQQISSLLQGINQELLQLSQRPVTLNVQPALQSLQQLMQAALAVAALLRAISGPIPAGPVAGPTLPGPVGGGSGGGRGAPRAFAGGGLVAGPTGIDSVPTRLSAGEYVLSRDAVATLGLSFLDQLNRGSGESAPVTQSAQGVLPTEDRRSATALNLRVQWPHANSNDARMSAISRGRSQVDPTASPSSTTNHFGGITIAVQEAGDIDSLMRDLNSRGIGLRNRHG